MDHESSLFFASTSAFALIVDREGKITSLNASWNSVTGVDSQRFVNRRLQEMLPPSTARLLQTYVKRVFDFGMPAQLSKTIEVAPGDMRHLHGDIFKLGENHVGLSAVDVSSLMEAQKLVEGHRARLVHAAQFSALAQLAAGVAHEINNPLAVIQGYSSVLSTHARQEKLTGELADRTASKIMEMVTRISKIVRGLQNFAREGDRDPFHALQINGLIEETLDLCQERFNISGITLDVRWRTEGLVIEGRQGQLVQALLNLLDNAREACASLEEKWVRIEISEVEDSVVIAIEDSGPGITTGIRSRVMEPFFSTKDPGKGVGLGLSNAKGIIETHGGVLTLNGDHPNTRFEIFIPKRIAARVAG